ncbi:MAG TPA: YegP family protein [Bacillota bacterium]|nr:YegP family protein [Bacillota bacterium]
MGKFVVKQVNTGFHFNLLAGNGQVIGVSEVYTTESACKNGIESVRNNSGAAVQDTTLDPVPDVKNPKYEVYTDKKGEFRFRLKASNGEIILASEGYTAKASCLNGIESVKNNAPDAEVEKI